MPLPPHVNKHLIERRQRACVICKHYHYSYRDKIKQIGSNYMAHQVAEGFRYRYGRPIGRSLLDAYIHDSCLSKIHHCYRYHIKNKSMEQNQSNNVTFPATDGRNSLNVNGSKSLVEDSSTSSMEISSTISYNQSVGSNNAELQLSALSCLFRPCMERVSTFYVQSYWSLFNIFPLLA